MPWRWGSGFRGPAGWSAWTRTTPISILSGDKLSSLPIRTDLVQGNFSDIDQVLADLGIDKVDVILADLGLSSAQLDDSQRGFTFQADAPLDMRIDKSQRTMAADLVNSLPEHELADLLFNLGDERFSRKIARAIYQGGTRGGSRGRCSWPT